MPPCGGGAPGGLGCSYLESFDDDPDFTMRTRMIAAPAPATNACAMPLSSVPPITRSSTPAARNLGHQRVRRVRATRRAGRLEALPSVAAALSASARAVGLANLCSASGLSGRPPFDIPCSNHDGVVVSVHIGRHRPCEEHVDFREPFNCCRHTDESLSTGGHGSRRVGAHVSRERRPGCRRSGHVLNSRASCRCDGHAPRCGADLPASCRQRAG